MLQSIAIGDGSIKPRALTVVESMQELVEVRAVPVTIKGKTFWLRTDIQGNAAKLFQVMGVRIPPKLLSVSE